MADKMCQDTMFNPPPVSWHPPQYQRTHFTCRKEDSTERHLSADLRLSDEVKLNRGGIPSS